MTLYFYTPRKDLAATSLADLQALIAALADETNPTNAATIARVTGKVESLVQSDSGEPLSLYFYDDASTVSSWVTDAGVTLAIGLGYPDPSTFNTYASTYDTAISGDHRTATLALNSQALADALAYVISCGPPSSRPANLTLHIRKTENGVTETVGLLAVEVFAGVLSTTPIASIVTPLLPAGPIASLPQIVGLASAVVDATKLGGLPTVSGLMLPNTVVLLNFSVTINDGAGTHTGIMTLLYRLTAGAHAAAVPLWVQPYDYNASTNAYVWRLIGAFLDTLPASWNADTSKFHYMGVAGAADATYVYADQAGTAAPA